MGYGYLQRACGRTGTSRLLVVALCCPLSALADVIGCPKFYPWEDTALAEVPFGHSGMGNVVKSPLAGASIWERELLGKGVELVGETNKVRGGSDTKYAFGPGEEKWLVCFYGKDGSIQWWERLGRPSTSCMVEVRTATARKNYPNDPVSVRAVCN